MPSIPVDVSDAIELAETVRQVLRASDVQRPDMTGARLELLASLEAILRASLSSASREYLTLTVSRLP